jgi:hypothetical protein
MQRSGTAGPRTSSCPRQLESARTPPPPWPRSRPVRT